MKFYYAWLTLPLDWRRGDPIYPQATHIHYIGDGLLRAVRGGFKTVMGDRRGLRVWEVSHLVRLPEGKVRELLHSDAQSWGDTYEESEFDQRYVENVVSRLYSHLSIPA
jgi:hypothetical protein